MTKDTQATAIGENIMIEGDTDIKSLIYIARGKQVMMDSDLADLYQVETGNLNKAMKRNQKRFPEEFCFQLNKEEYDNLKFQIGISKENEHGGRRKLPYVYTEQGIAMLSAVLRSDIAIQVSVRIMKTFVEIRKYLANNALLLEKVNTLEMKQLEVELRQKEFEENTEEKFNQVFNYIESHEEENQKIFFDGQIFDAYSLLTKIVGQAEKRIVLIDGYVDVSTLNIIAKKKEGVEVIIFTLPSSKLTAQDINSFNAQYKTLEVRKTTLFHDRFLIIDDKKGYHIGASIKDAGKKCFGINLIEDVSVIKELIDKAEAK